MDVSVIIINYKTPELVEQCVESIIANTKGLKYEIIVVDNGSDDGSCERLQNSLPQDVKLIASPENLGFGKANNLGAHDASGKYLFLLNSDTLLLNDAIGILFQFISSHQDVGIVGGNLFSKDGMPSGSYCENFDTVETMKERSSWMNIINSIWKRKKRDRLPIEEQVEQRYRENFNFTDKPKNVAYVYGTDLMISRTLFNSLKGFDPDFFMYGEETEMSYRAHQKGLNIVSVPAAQIRHYDGASTIKNQGFNRRQYQMRQKGTMLYFEKSFGTAAVNLYRFYKRRELRRTRILAKIFRRKALLDLTQEQLDAFDQACRDYIQRGLANG